MLFIVMVPLASAHIGTPVYSSWTTNSPSIEGVISGGEWTDATVVDFTFDMRGTGGGHSEYLTAKFYVKNDANNIYVAIEVFDEDYDAEDGLFLWDGCAIFFEEDNDDVLDTMTMVWKPPPFQVQTITQTMTWFTGLGT